MTLDSHKANEIEVGSFALTTFWVLQSMQRQPAAGQPINLLPSCNFGGKLLLLIIGCQNNLRSRFHPRPSLISISSSFIYSPYHIHMKMKHAGCWFGLAGRCAQHCNRADYQVSLTVFCFRLPLLPMCCLLLQGFLSINSLPPD